MPQNIQTESLTASNDGITLINSHHLNLFSGVFKSFCSRNVLQIIIKASVGDFIYSKVQCFQDIPLSVKYGNMLSVTSYFGHSRNIQLVA